jgi:hypothetical protein
VSAEGQLVGLNVAEVHGLFWLYLLLGVYAPENSHRLHVHAADASQEGFFQVLLDQRLVVLVLLVFARGLS